MTQQHRPTPPQATTSEQPRPRSAFPWLLKAALAGGGLYIGYKAIQALSDKEYSGRTLPRSVRDRLKDDQVFENGEVCLKCGVDTDYYDLVIDHIFSYALGGRTSIRNSQVICRWCNGEKGARVSFGDRIRGRGGRRF